MLLSPSIGMRKDLKLKGSAPVSKERAKELLQAFDGHSDGTVLVLDVETGVEGHFTRDMVEMLLMAFDGWTDAAVLELEIREFGVWVVVPMGAEMVQRLFIGEAKMIAPELGRIH